MPSQAPISVIIPAYNAERFIALTLQSIHEQTLPAAEVIVVDDGSADRTFEIARDFNVRIIRQSNMGLSAARNAGIRAATQPWIALIDADDLWARDKIEQQWKALSLCPEADMVSCDYQRIDSRGHLLDLPQFDPHLRRQYSLAHGSPLEPSATVFKKVSGDLFPLFSLLPSTILVKREALLASGLFDEKLRCTEDLECFLRVLADRSLLVIERPLVYYRRHEDNLSNNVLEMHLALEEVGEKINSSVDQYVTGVTEAFQKYLRQSAVESGRQLIDRQQFAEARTLFLRVLKKKYLWRPAFLFIFSYSPQVVFKGALNIKRALVRMKVIDEEMQFCLLKN
jgi:glycosyltransferase involved in cell wall biosynthesis